MLQALSFLEADHEWPRISPNAGMGCVRHRDPSWNSNLFFTACPGYGDQPVPHTSRMLVGHTASPKSPLMISPRFKGSPSPATLTHSRGAMLATEMLSHKAPAGGDGRSASAVCRRSRHILEVVVVFWVMRLVSNCEKVVRVQGGGEGYILPSMWALIMRNSLRPPLAPSLMLSE